MRPAVLAFRSLQALRADGDVAGSANDARRRQGDRCANLDAKAAAGIDPSFRDLRIRAQYGGRPAAMTWETVAEDRHAMGGRAVTKTVKLYFAGKRDGPSMELAFTLPVAAKPVAAFSDRGQCAGESGGGAQSRLRHHRRTGRPDPDGRAQRVCEEHSRILCARGADRAGSGGVGRDRRMGLGIEPGHGLHWDGQGYRREESDVCTGFRDTARLPCGRARRTRASR